jgi:hypothetical protein
MAHMASHQAKAARYLEFLAAKGVQEFFFFNRLWLPRSSTASLSPTCTSALGGCVIHTTWLDIVLATRVE